MIFNFLPYTFLCFQNVLCWTCYLLNQKSRKYYALKCLHFDPLLTFSHFQINGYLMRLMVTSTESQALRSTTKDNKCQYETKIKEERRVLDQLEWTPEEEAIPNLGVIRREKKYRTNLEYLLSQCWREKGL